MPTRSCTYSVYAIQLDDEVTSNPQFLELNPCRDGRKPCVYVGQTALKPEARFQQHRAGRKASKWVRRFGKRLRPEFGMTVETREEAERQEALVAERLRAQGFGVVGGH